MTSSSDNFADSAGKYGKGMSKSPKLFGLFEAGAPVVHIVSGMAVGRQRLRKIIEADGWATADYDSIERFIAQFHPRRPGCLLLDMRISGMSGPDLWRELSRRETPLLVILMTDRGSIGLAAKAVKDGAFNFLEIPVTPARLLARVRLAIEYNLAAICEQSREKRKNLRLAQLTARERQVLDRVVLGETNKAIAQHIGISEKTIEVFRSRFMRKLAAKSRADLIRIVRPDTDQEAEP